MVFLRYHISQFHGLEFQDHLAQAIFQQKYEIFGTKLRCFVFKTRREKMTCQRDKRPSNSQEASKNAIDEKNPFLRDLEQVTLIGHRTEIFGYFLSRIKLDRNSNLTNHKFLMIIGVYFIQSLCININLQENDSSIVTEAAWQKYDER